MIDTTRNPQTPSPKLHRLLRSRFLAGTALTLLVLGGAAAGGYIASPWQPARADTVPASADQSVRPDFADLVQKVSPAVVSIRVRETSSPMENSTDNFNGASPDLGGLPPQLRQFFQNMPNQNTPDSTAPGQVQTALGSGFFISADGYVVTNNHVVDNASNFTIIIQDGTEYRAKLIGKDEKTDVALLKVTADKGFPFVNFSQDPIRVGQWIMAVGNPFGLGGTVTAGIVSATGRNIGSGPYDNFIQIDAPVNRGNSGGPTFNLKGDVIGINTEIYSPSGGSVGIAFDIPASSAEHVIDALKDHGHVVRGWLGVEIQPVTQQLAESMRLDKAAGALVTQPQDNSPAGKAGIQAGDTILAVDGQSVKDPGDLATKIAGYAPGTSVTLNVWRDGQKKEVPVELGTLPSADQQAALQSDVKPTALAGLGLSLAPSHDGKGVIIANVDTNGSAADSGLNQGDVIVSVGGTKVSTPADVEKQVSDARKSGLKAVLLRVQSGSETHYVGLSFANA
jgi:serine protease Do